MTDFNIEDFQTFDIQKRRQELANPPVSQAVLDARAKTAQMANDYNKMNQFVALATGRRAGSPMEIPSYSDGPTSTQTKAADEEAAREFMRSLEKMQEQLGRPIRENEIPAIASAYGLGSKGLAIVDKYFKYIGRTEAQDIAARGEERAEIRFTQEQEKDASDDRINASVFGTMSNHRADIVGSNPETVVNRIEEAVADIYGDETLTAQEKLDAAAKVYERMGKVANLNKTQREELRKIKDKEVATTDRALKTGRTITRNRLVQEVIDRVSKGEDYEVVKNEVMGRANDMYSDDYLQDKDMLASLRQGIEFAKKPDARSTASRNFDETMALLRPTNPYSNVVEDERAFNTSKVIQMEMESGKNIDPRWYDYTMPQKMSQAVEQTFLKLKIADPYFDEDAIINSFAVFDATNPTEEQSERKLEDLVREYKLPVNMIFYILYGKKDFEEYLEKNVYVK